MSDPLIGSQLGNYLIEEILGRGGMGVVYAARDTALDRRVALKVLAPGYAEDEAFRGRFERESRLAASLDHPNVVPVFDAGETDGRLFIAMRYVAGTDLKRIIREEGPLAPERVARIIAQIAGALDEAHGAGLVHRDIKPANILITPFGEGERRSEHAYLTDFGVSKRSGSQSALTQTGAFVGTIDYISPEQIEGKSLDHRTDVYSLGCVAFEALTGETPFSKDSDVAVLWAHLTDPRPSATEKRADLPIELDTVMQRAMARDPAERYESAGALGEACSRVFSSTTSASVVSSEILPTRAEEPARVDERHDRARSLPSRKLLALGGALLAIAGLAFVMFGGSDDPPTDTGNEPQPGSAIEAVFVDPEGSDGAAGTESEPVASLQDAIDMAGPGGRVVLGDGVYNTVDSGPIAVVDDPVTIEAAEGAIPIIRGGKQGGNGIYIVAGTSDVTVRGLEFEALGEPIKVFCEICEDKIENRNITLEKLSISGSSQGIIVENVENLRLDAVNIQETVGSGLLCNPGPCNSVEISSSVFQGATGQESDGIQIVIGEGVVIQDSTVSNNADDGIDVDSEFTQITRTQVLGNQAIGLLLWASNAVVSDSIFARNGGEAISICPEGCDPDGIFSAGNILVTGNGSRTGADAVTVAPDKPSHLTFELFNSIFTDNRGTSLVLGSKVAITRLDFNLFDPHTISRPVIEWKGKTYDGNDLNYSRFPGNVDSGTYLSRPTFVAPDDYHLREGSDGVDDGTDEGVSATDLDGNPRPRGKKPDRGPYER